MDSKKDVNKLSKSKRKIDNFEKIDHPDKIEIDDSEKSDKKVEKKRLAKRLFIRLVIVHIGTYAVCVLYVVAGAYLFQLLEKQNFIENCQTAQGKTSDLVKSYRSSLFNYIYFNTTSSYLIDQNSTNRLDTPSVYGPVIKKKLMAFRDEVLQIYSTYKYYGQDCLKENLWSFESAFLLTVTIVSTLGYGHVTPTTWQGQIVCICYATVGIPIFLMAVNNISTVLSDIFVNVYGSLVCRSKKKDEEDDSEKEHDDKSGLKLERENTTGFIGSNNDKSNLIVNEDEENDEEEDEEKEDKINVPLVIILFVMIGYLVLGGYGFTLIEKWTLVQAIYYALISVSTIGLGDYVPGIQDLSSGKEKNAAGNLLIAIAFIFVGIGLLGMCFKLIQDTITEKIQFLSKFLGISSDDNHEIDENITKTSANNHANMPDHHNHQKTDEIDIEHMIAANDNIMFVKPSSSISSSSLVESDDGQMFEAPVPVIPGPTITTETKNEILKFDNNGHSSSAKSNRSSFYPKSKETTEVRIRNKVKPAEYK